MTEGSWIRIGAIEANLDATTVNNIIKTALGKRAITVTQMPELRKEIGEELLRIVTPFVPMKSGQLRASGRATDDGRLYWTGTNKGYNYADIVYDRDSIRWESGYKKPTTPNTVPRWMEKVQPHTDEWTTFVNNITPIIIRRFAEGD